MHLPLKKDLSNQEIADVFNFIAGVLALQKANPFRSRAYLNAASVIEQLEQPLSEMFLTNPDFDDLPGIGDTLQQKLVELFTTGNVKALQEYVADIPASVFVLDKVHGLGVKRGYVLAKAFHLDNADTAITDLIALAQAGKIRDLEGFGEKSEADILAALQAHVTKKRLPYAVAKKIADQLVAELKECPDIAHIEVLGSLRRQLETIGDVDIGIAVKDMGRVKEFVKNMKSVKRIVVAGDQLMRVQLQDGNQVDIKVATPEEWGSFLQHFTGSKEHNIRLRELAIKQGKSLSEHGIKENGQLKLFEDEKSFYADLGLPWIPPQDRVGGAELAQ